MNDHAINDHTTYPPEAAPTEWAWYAPQKEDTLYAIDIETDYDWKAKMGGENIIQAAISSKAGTVVSREHWLELAVEAARGHVVGHNSWGFDVPRLKAAGISMPYGSDTMVLCYLLDENQPLGLEILCVKYLGAPPWKDEGHIAFADVDKFALYNARDAQYTLQLYTYCLENLGASVHGIPRERIASEILLPVKLALEDCSRRGNFVNLPNVLAAESNCIAQRDVALAQLQQLVGEKFNPNSTAQVGAWMLENGMALPKTATGKPQTDKGAVAKYRGTPFVDSLEMYRESVKELSTYVKPYKEAAAAPGGRLHPEYSCVRTVVGRSSCKEPNVQNLKRKFKNFITAPPGKVLVSADFSALHIRLFAWVAQEERMLAEYAANPNWDPHMFFAKQLYGKEDITTAERQIAKSANFSLLYMGQATALHDYAAKLGISIPIAECARLRKAWHETFTGALPFYLSVRGELLDKGYVETPVGRRRHFGTPEDVRKAFKAHPSSFLGGKFAGYLREAVNFKVLGLEPDIALPALSACHAAGLPISRFVHDSIEFEFDNLEHYLNNKDLITHCMTVSPVVFLQERFEVSMNTPLLIDFTVHE